MMLQKTIAYVGGFELPDGNAAAHRVLTNAKIFRELGFQVVLIGTRKGQAHDVEERICDGFVTYSLKYPASAIKWLERYFGVGQYEKILQGIGRDGLRAIVLYNEKSFLQYRLRAWAKKRGVRIIADVTEWHAHSGWGPASLFKKLDVALRMRVFSKLADGLITTSSYISNYYSSRGVLKARIVELPTLFDGERAATIVRKDRPTRRDGQLALIYAGTPFNVKRVRSGALKERLDRTIDVFLHIKAARPGTMLSIFGVTREEFLRHYPDYRSTIDACGSSLRFYGLVPNRTVLREIAGSDFTIFFRDENRVTLSGFPTKFSESITYGTPVITNRSPGIEKYAVPGENCLLVDPDDAVGLRQIVDFVATLDSSAIANLKHTCLESKQFDYRAYTRAVGRFLEVIGV